MIKTNYSTSRRLLFVYFLLAFIFTWSKWIPQALISRGYMIGDVPEGIGLIAGYGPALAAILITFFAEGKAGLKNLFGRLLLWRVPAKWYVIVLSLPLVMALTAYGLHLILDAAALKAVSIASIGHTISLPGFWQELAMFGGMFLFGFDGLGEELGWRGFALPRLLAKYQPLVASLVLGIGWSLWHLPYALTLNSAMSGQPFHYFISSILAAAILYTWIFKHTSGSILIALLFHAAGNTTYNMLRKLAPGIYDTGVWGQLVPWLFVLLVIIINGSALQRTEPSCSPSGTKNVQPGELVEISSSDEMK